MQSTSHIADHGVGVRADKHIQIPSINSTLVTVRVHVLDELTEVVLLQKHCVFVHVREVAARSYLEAAEWTGMQDLILFLNATTQPGNGVEEETQDCILHEGCNRLNGSRHWKPQFPQSLRSIEVEKNRLDGLAQHAHCAVTRGKQRLQSTSPLGFVAA